MSFDQRKCEGEINPEVNQILIICSTIMLTLYAFMIAAILHNTIRYVVIGKRYSNFHIVYFYLLVSLCVTLRVVWLSYILKVVVLNNKEDTGKVFMP